MCDEFVFFIAPLSGGMALLDVSVVMLALGFIGKDGTWESVARLLRTSGASLLFIAVCMLNAGYFMELAMCVLLLFFTHAVVLPLAPREFGSNHLHHTALTLSFHCQALSEECPIAGTNKTSAAMLGLCYRRWSVRWLSDSHTAKLPKKPC